MQSKRHRYYGFGLTIQAPLLLPELVEIAADSATVCDIEIAFGTVEEHPRCIDESGHGFWVRDDEACYLLKEVGVFFVSQGRSIRVEPHRNASEEALRLCILGPVLALALQQRGFFMLHASAVSVQGGAVAFMGGHAWGKSTMAAMLQARGLPVISDDLTAVRWDDDTVIPSFPQLKLWPDAVRALGKASHELPQVHPDVEKRALRFTDGFALDPLPLRRLYLLAVGDSIMIEPLAPTQVFEELNRHWYGTRFGRALFDSLDQRAHFLRISRLARAVPVQRLQRPATLLSDPSMGEHIEKAILENLNL